MSYDTQVDEYNRDDYYYLGPNPTMKPREWWESLRPFFQEKGYTLYQTKYCDPNKATYWEIPSSIFSGDINFPYAYIGGCGYCKDECPIEIIDPHPRVVFAQDAQSQHVCIRVLRPKYDEYEILKLLHGQHRLLEYEEFPGVTPVLDLFSKDEHHFAVFPRWDGYVNETIPWFSNMGEVLDYIWFLLKGLSFLHEHRIFCRDINSGNMLTNHFACGYNRWFNEMRQILRSSRKLVYSLNDFDLSLLLPPETDIKTFQMPIESSYTGCIETPNRRYGAIEPWLALHHFKNSISRLRAAKSRTEGVPSSSHMKGRRM